MSASFHPRCFVLALALLASLFAAGCSHTRYGAARFSSAPPGAEVLNLKDRTSLGLTPLIVTWGSEKGEPEQVNVLLRKTGYEDADASFWLNTRHESPEDARADPQPVHVVLRERN